VAVVKAVYLSDLTEVSVEFDFNIKFVDTPIANDCKKILDQET
jgi:hypothetical protein